MGGQAVSTLGVDLGHERLYFVCPCGADYPTLTLFLAHRRRHDRWEPTPKARELLLREAVT